MSNLFSQIDNCCDETSTTYSFSISDGVTTQTIANGDTVNFTDGTGIDVVVSATDIVTINLNAATTDLTDFNNTAATTTGQVPVWDQGLLEWVPGAVPATFSCSDLNTCSIDDLVDVNASLPITTGSSLVWDGVSAYEEGTLVWTIAADVFSASVFVTDATHTPNTVTFIGGDGLVVSGAAGPNITYAIDTSGASASEVLTFDGANTSWAAVATTFTCNNLSACFINDLGDVNTVGASTGDVLELNGSNVWVPVAKGTITTEYFNSPAAVVPGGNTVTLAATPTSVISVERNGIGQQPTLQWTIAANIVTFTSANFGSTSGADPTDNETVTVIYVV